jgi:hypothetical protein
MILILMMLALADITIAVKGTSIYYHTGECAIALLARVIAEHR